MTKSLLKTLLKYAVGLGLLAYVVARNWEGEHGLKEALTRPVQWPPFLAAGALLAASALFTFYRWWLLVRALDMPFRLGNALRLGKQAEDRNHSTCDENGSILRSERQPAVGV